MWAWAHEKPVEQPPSVDASTVAAVLVAHNGELWLPRTLVALARLDARPGRLVAVDAGSTDGSRALLDKGLHDGLLHSVIEGRPEEGYGANVRLALQAISEDGFMPRLLWFLHDDSAPSRHALTQLLQAAQEPDEQGRLPAIVVPKLLHPKRRNHPDQMSAVGESIAPSGARVLTVEPGDIDQHQVTPAPVLGASTAGMLVTMDAWRALGGFQAAVPLFRDGVDLGWRANAQGLSVRTCPKASVRHVEAGRVGLRDSVLAPDSAQADQAAGMAVVVMHSDKPERTIARLSAQSVVQAVGYLLGKSPRLAAGQLRAAAEIRRNRAHLVEAARKSTSAGRDLVTEGLLPDRGWGTRRFFDRIAGAISDQYYDLIEDDDGGMLDELTGDDFAGGRRRARLLSPAIIGLIAMFVASMVASRHLLTTGLLSGPGLLPAPANLADAWANWSASAPGVVGSNAAWLGVMALGATLSFGQPDWWATLLVLGGPALAAWAAFRFLRGISGHGWWTPVLACLWGTLLPLVGATGQGLVEMTVLAIALPTLGMIVRRWVIAPKTGAEGLRAPAGVALIGGVLASFMPWAWLIAVAVGVFMAVRHQDRRGALVAGLGPLLLLGPWLPRLLSEPGRLLLGVDPATRVAGTAPSALHVLTGGAQLPAAPLALAMLSVALIWVVGVFGAIRADDADRLDRAALLAVAVVSPVLGVLVTRFVVRAAGVGVRPDPTGWVLIGLFALLVLAAHGIGRSPERTVDDSAEDLVRRQATIRRRSALGAGMAAALLAAGGWWVVGGTAQLSRGAEVLPTYVLGVQESARESRTLMVDLSSGAARFNVTSATVPAWGSAETAVLSTSNQAAAALEQAAQQFAQGQPSDDLARRLEALGIAHVWLRGATPEAVSSLSSAPQMGVAPHDKDSVIFTVTTQPSRALLRTGGPDTDQSILDAMVPSAASDALIVLNEPADADWQAEIDGVVLPVVESGDWRQAWATEGRTGTLTYRLDADVLGVGWQVVGLLLLIVLAAPTAQKGHSPRRALAPHPGRNRGSTS